jgi:hypothetical protein
MKLIALIFKLLGRAGLAVLAYLGAVFRGVLDAVARGEYVDHEPYRGGYATEHEWLEANSTKYE